MDMKSDPRGRKTQYRATALASQAAPALPREIWIPRVLGQSEFVMIPAGFEESHSA